MLTPRNKIIILIVGALVVLAVIISTVFNLWPGKKPVPTETAPVDLSFLEKDENLPQGQTFDESNKMEFAALTGAQDLGDSLSLAEREARDLAEFFVERFGTYSTDAPMSQIDDVLPFVTANMRSWLERFRATAPDREGFFATAAKVASIAKEPAAAGLVNFFLVVNRSEESNGQKDSYQQAATVELRQDAAGEWKVGSLFWGEKL